jgi:hypothetical protein
MPGMLFFIKEIPTNTVSEQLKLKSAFYVLNDIILSLFSARPKTGAVHKTGLSELPCRLYSIYYYFL